MKMEQETQTKPFSPPFSASSSSTSPGGGGGGGSKKKTINIKPPPISMIPSLRNQQSQGPMSISSILNPNLESNSAGRRLESEESSDWNTRTGRVDNLAIRFDSPFLGSGTTSSTTACDRFGNRFGIESHLLSPVIRLVIIYLVITKCMRVELIHISIFSERTERTMTTTMTSWKEKDLETAKRRINKRNQKQKRDQVE